MPDPDVTADVVGALLVHPATTDKVMFVSPLWKKLSELLK